MGSETEFVLRIARHGHRAWHARAAVVEHFIRDEQLQKSWVWQRALRLGRGRYRLSFLAGDRERLFLGIPRYLFWDIPKKTLRVLLASATFRPEELFDAMWYFNFRCGQAMEARIISREMREASTRPSKLRAPMWESDSRGAEAALPLNESPKSRA